jgi:hypothetical protein
MSTGGSSKIQTGFFKRLFNAINAKRYEMKKTNTEKYLVNWDKIKWRYRTGKFLFIATFFFAGTHFFVNRNLILSEMKNDRENLKSDFKNFLTKNWNKLDDENYFEQLKKSCESINKFFKSDLQLGDQTDLKDKENSENELLFNITKILVDTVENDPEIRKNENFKYLDIQNDSGEFLLKNNLLQKIIFATYTKKYSTDNVPKEIENLIKLAEIFYKKLICSTIPKNYLILSTNLIDEFPSIEQTAFPIALNLIDFFGSVKMCDSMELNFQEFFNKVLDKNYSFYKGRFQEDFKYLLEDLKKTKDIKTFIVVNPFLYLNFRQEVENLKEILIEKQTEINIKKILLALDLMNRAGFDVSNLWSFSFDKINYQILDIVRKIKYIIYFLLKNIKK